MRCKILVHKCLGEPECIAHMLGWMCNLILVSIMITSLGLLHQAKAKDASYELMNSALLLVRRVLPVRN